LSASDPGHFAQAEAQDGWSPEPVEHSDKRSKIPAPARNHTLVVQPITNHYPDSWHMGWFGKYNSFLRKLFKKITTK
jgi:hypothetical protein